MTVFEKNGIEVYMPDDDEKSRQNMIVAAEFMARMIQKYGKKVLAKIEEKERLAAFFYNDKLSEDVGYHGLLKSADALYERIFRNNKNLEGKRVSTMAYFRSYRE